LEDGFAPRDALPVATALIPILTIAPMQGCPAQQSHHCANTLKELVKLYRRASVFIQPSRVTSSGDRDGMPNVLFEAMLFGLPVVATSVSAIPELVVDRVTGLLVPPNNPEELATCVQTRLQDQELAQQIAAAGKRKVEEEFDSMTTTERLVRIYREPITASAMS
jgi:glycosyltransferase involved in cell wall biosynthesis